MADAGKQKEIMEQLETALGAVYDSDSFRSYLDMQARFHSYSFGNTMLIAMQKPDAQKVAGFKTWLALGRHVRKGEKGIKILVPYMKKYETDDGQEGRAPVGFGVGHVFDVSQTDGDELPSFDAPLLTADEGHELYTRLSKVAAAEGIMLREEATSLFGAAGYYNPRERTIVVVPAARAQMTKTLAHELAHHYTGMHETYGAERPLHETIAEAVAYTVCSYFGLDSSDRSLPYIASWSKDRDSFKRALAQIQKVSHTLIKKIEEHS